MKMLKMLYWFADSGRKVPKLAQKVPTQIVGRCGIRTHAAETMAT